MFGACACVRVCVCGGGGGGRGVYVEHQYACVFACSCICIVCSTVTFVDVPYLSFIFSKYRIYSNKCPTSESQKS